MASRALLLRPDRCVLPAFLHINAKPDNHRRRGAQREEEREAVPIVACPVDDGLDNVGADHRGGAVG